MTASVTRSQPPPQPEPLTRPSEREAFWFWLKLGCISFGGPAGQIAIMHDELVERRRWISERRFLHALNFCMALARAGGAAARLLRRLLALRRPRRDHRGRPVRAALVRPALRDERASTSSTATSPWSTASCSGLGAAVVALVAAAVLRVGGRVIHTPAASRWRRSLSARSSPACRSRSSSRSRRWLGYLAGRSRPACSASPAGTEATRTSRRRPSQDDGVCAAGSSKRS